MGIKVVLHRVLVKRDVPEETGAMKTKKEMERLGLTAPKSVLDEIDKQAGREEASMDKGIVVGIGPTAFKDYGIESPIKEGDYVCFTRFGGKNITDPETGETLVCINDEDVVALLTK